VGDAGIGRGVSDPEDDAAFAELVERNRVAVYRYARRRVSEADAADVVAEVFAAAWRHRDRLPEPVERWLYRTAWNALLHQFRSARRQASLTARLLQEHRPEPGGPIDGGEAVRSALATLRPIDQELLRLAYWEQLDAAEIAFVVGGTPAAVRVRLHRARRRLATRLPDDDPVPEQETAR
jgi:RNA polymerase sigma-70 factor (ECF subfamily)